MTTLDLESAATLLGISPSTLQARAKAGVIPGCKIGRAWRFIEDSGIKPATWHDLRHTWASWHVQAGTPLAVLKTLGGWASMDMVMRYSHLAPEHVSEWAGNAEKVKVKRKRRAA